MASAFLSSILSKTSQVLGCVRSWAVSPSSSSDPRSSVLEDLKELERTLERISAVLHDAEEREIRDKSVKLWLKELKEVAYEADDVLDEYQYEVLRARGEGRASHKRKRVEGDDEEQVSIPDGMGDRIRKIRERFDKISQDRESLHLREEDGERRVLEAPYPAPTSHKVDESSIYGREHDKQAIIDLLFSEGVGHGISVVPIVGKGGLGKTTIAQLVYNDPKVKQYFNLTGWVCVSDDFDVKRLTKDIIECITQNPCHLAQLSTLQDTLEEKLKGKRVLLVLDDVWNDQQSHWERVLLPFVGAETVRIIVTCRNDSVAEIMQTVHPYHPRCLSLEQSWALFRHYAFHGRDPEEQPRLLNMGKQIVEKCSGLPLAVKSIGSLLRYTTDEDSWMDVIQSDIWEVDENNEILPALRLSYSRMPAHLKPCFVYCSMFPKDYEFDKDELVRLWMAQAYIQTCGGRRRTEDIGSEYFNDLQRRSFFDSYWSKFKMHNMIHDLAKSIAVNECWAIMDKKLPSHPDEVRHVFVKADEKEFGKSLCSNNLRALRTLIIQHQLRFPTAIQELIKFLLLLRCLRTLEFCWEREDEIPDLLGNLKHLRYLRITSNKIEKLSKSICLLYHLQTLVLDFPHLTELPDDLGNLTNLRYLNITSNKIKKLPESICLLYHLQILVLDCRNLAELPDGLGNLTNLHHLQIVNKVNLCLPAGIGKLANLQSLLGCYKVQGGIGEVLKDLVNLQGFLRISGLKNLVNIENVRDAGLKHKHKLEKLFLHWKAVDCENDLRHNRLLHLESFLEKNKDVPADEKREEAMLKYLQPHANLKVLSIKGYGGSKFPEWVGNPFSFASLQEIDIIGCEKIRSLPLYIHDSLENLDAPISPSMLERVYISGCRQLTSIVGLHHLHSLKDMKIYNCPQLQLLSEEGLPSNLQGLHIEECRQLTSLPGMQNITSLGALTIRNCPQLQRLSEEGLPSNLQGLHIEECQQLTSLSGMQILTSLEKLIIKNCSKLQIMAEDQLSSVPFRVQIINCPGLSNWCQRQRINCIQVASGNKMTISNKWENIMHRFEHFCFSSSWELLLPRDSIPVLKRLTIWGCMKISPLQCLPKLTSLQSLVIKDCPGVQVLQDELLPSTLESLVVDSCEDLTFLRLGQQDRHTFEELQLVNCPKLIDVEGLNCLFLIKILRIERCPRLQLPQDDLPERISLRSLVIKDCPGVRVLQDRLLPATLKSLVVDSCEDLTFLRLVQQNRYAFKELQLVNCPKLEWVEELNCLFLTKILRIERCPRLRLLQDDLPECISLQSLVIKDCPGVRVLQDRLLPSTLESLVVDSCEEITFLQFAQQNRHAIKELQLVNCSKLEQVEGLNCYLVTNILRIERCPRLQLPQDNRRPYFCRDFDGCFFAMSYSIPIVPQQDDWQPSIPRWLSCMPRRVQIIDCPGLSNWCQIQRIECIQVASGNKLTLSNKWKKIMHWFDDLTSDKHLCFSNEWELFRQIYSIPVFEELTIWGCTKIQQLWFQPELRYLRSLVIKDCPGVRVLQDKLFPSTLESLVVDSCGDLRVLQLAEQNRYVFKELQLVNCPKLKRMDGLNWQPSIPSRVEDQLSSVPYRLKIVDCPRLSNWCQLQRINCIQVASGNKLTISNTWENIMHGFDDLTSDEHLCFSNSWELFMETDSIPVLEELTIWCCTNIPPLRCLPKLTSLRSLVIKDCSGVQVLEDKLLPSTVQSLEVDSCEDLTFLLLAQQNRDAFEELQLVNCAKLIWVEGLNCLFFPKILRIERCPQLSLPQDDRENRGQRNN